MKGIKIDFYRLEILEKRATNDSLKQVSTLRNTSVNKRTFSKHEKKLRGSSHIPVLKGSHERERLYLDGLWESNPEWV